MRATAKLRLARISPRKVRLTAGLVRGRDVGEAIEILTFSRKKSAGMLKKLIESAVANAEFKAKQDNQRLDIDDLVVSTVLVDQGPTLRRFRPRVRGMATKILKRTSHITVVLDNAPQDS
jgi:large subunit ribosomal protein L22